eukprot:6429945-Ditylum_brightwellii.AAC.1
MFGRYLPSGRCLGSRVCPYLGVTLGESWEGFSTPSHTYLVLYYCVHSAHHLENVFHDIPILCSDSCIHDILWPLLLVVDRVVALAVIVHPIHVSLLPFYVELLLCLPALKPMEAHVHGLRLFWTHTSCGEAVCGAVVGD